MGLTMREKKPPVPHSARSRIQSYVRVFNFISWGV